jgi:RNA polymerase sigma-70 factor (ECF subfamily)
MNVDESSYEWLVEMYYAPLYRFALSLSRHEQNAADLVQETFCRLAAKGQQLRDASKAKTWLFTTLYREFLRNRRNESRFDSLEVVSTPDDLIAPETAIQNTIDGGRAKDALMQLDPLYRAPLVLFYLEEHSYVQIAEILGIPVGTVMSRISRGRDLLRKLLADSGKNDLNPMCKGLVV